MKAGVLVIAKAPVPGRAKTRLAADTDLETAADLAAASLLDTLDACERAFPLGRRAIALDGDLRTAARSTQIKRRLNNWEVFHQRGDEFGQRLAFAHCDAASFLCGPVVQIGSDTPQVTSAQLSRIAHDLEGWEYDAVLGGATDGGWWALAVTDPRWSKGLVDVPMSTSNTGRATAQMLRSQGARVAYAEQMLDVDTAPDADAVSRIAPDTRFAQTWRARSVSPPSPSQLFDAALAGAPCALMGR